MKYNCSGCGIEFDLPVTRYKSGKAWGKTTFYHDIKCVTKTSTFTVGKTVDNGRKKVTA